MQNVNKILLKRSSALSGGTAKQPTPQDIDSGELAMNYADGYESLFIKNSNGEIVKFSSDEVYTIEKLGEKFSSTTVQELIEDDEEIIAAALTDLNAAISEKIGEEELTEALAGKQDKLVFDTEPIENSTNPCESGGIYKFVSDSEMVIAAALNDLKQNKQDVFQNGSVLSAISTNDVSAWTGKISGIRVNGSGLTPDSSYIVDIPTQSFDYDEEPTSGSTNLVNSGDLYEVFRELELIIGSSLNDLNSRLIEVSDETDYLSSQIESGEASKIDGMTLNGSGVPVVNKVIVLSADTAPSNNSDRLITSKGVYDALIENEYIVSTALSDLNANKQDKLTAGPGITIRNGIISASTSSGGGGITGVTFNNTPASVVNDVANITATIPSSLSDLTSNADVLTTITSQKVSNWDSAASASHSHGNKAVLDNLTQTVIDNSHTHGNKSVLDGITTAKTQSWDTVTAKTDNTTFTAHTSNTTAHVTTAQTQSWDSAVSASHSHTNKTVLDGITTAKTQSWDTVTAKADNTAFTAHSATTIPSAVSAQMHLPTVTAADNGKILMVVNGAWALVSPTTIYTGSGTPDSSQGNDGDIYLQTS